MNAEHRRAERAAGYDKAILLDTMTPGYLRDLSATGAQVAFLRPVSVSEGQTVVIRVIPVHDGTIASFRLSFEVRWVRSDPVWFVMGGQIRCSTGQDAASLNKLVEYYEDAARR